MYVLPHRPSRRFKISNRVSSEGVDEEAHRYVRFCLSLHTISRPQQIHPLVI